MSWIVPRSRCVYLPLRLSVCLCFFVFSPAPLVSRLSYCVRLFRVSPRWLLLLLLSRFLYYSLVPFFRRDEFACTCVSIITTPLAFKHVRTRFPGRVTRSSFRMLSFVVLVFLLILLLRHLSQRCGQSSCHGVFWRRSRAYSRRQREVHRCRALVG